MSLLIMVIAGATLITDIVLLIIGLRHMFNSIDRKQEKESRLFHINRALLLYTVLFVLQIIVFGIIINNRGPSFLPWGGFGRDLIILYLRIP